MKPLLTLAAVLAVAGPALAESRSVLVVVTHKAGKASVTIHSDDKVDRRRDVTVADACKAVAAMRGWGSSVNVYLVTDRALSRADRQALFDAIDGNVILALDHYGRQAPTHIAEHFRASPDELRGVWVVTDDGGANPVRPDGHAKGTRWVFEAGRLTVGDEAKQPEPDRVVRTYTTDTSKNPRTIDVHLGPPARIGPAAYVQHGIYELDGDRLKLFLAMLNRDRPTAFPPPGGAEQYRVLTLTRQTPGP
jgi:uncharacterized protein (TIGR03067 family)